MQARAAVLCSDARGVRLGALLHLDPRHVREADGLQDVLHVRRRHARDEPDEAAREDVELHDARVVVVVEAALADDRVGDGRRERALDGREDALRTRVARLRGLHLRRSRGRLVSQRPRRGGTLDRRLGPVDRRPRWTRGQVGEVDLEAARPKARRRERQRRAHGDC